MKKYNLMVSTSKSDLGRFSNLIIFKIIAISYTIKIINYKNN